MLRLLSALLLISILSMYGLIAWELAWNMWPDDPKRCPIYRPLPNCEPPQPQPIEIEKDDGHGLPDDWRPM